tara:strand:+ start:1293 stop:1889 length:597 start_codon:yes stop_codon:yes gene_type:complete
MITFDNASNEEPFKEFKKKYENALQMKQKNIEAMSISSFSKELNEVNSRFVNLKFIKNRDLIFFSNYDSPKSREFEGHDQVAALIYWNSINTQIRLKATIKRTSKDFNKEYFLNRAPKKNALAISSKQSKFIDSYESVKKNFDKALASSNLLDCPDYWGGFSLTPFYFEFWEGRESRVNKRLAFNRINGDWRQSILEP